MEYKTFNKNLVIENFTGDEDILLELISQVFASFDKLMESISNAIEKKDGQALKINAHTIKGFASSFYAEPFREMAFKLEQMGAKNNFENTRDLYNQLKSLVDNFLQELKTLSTELRK